MKIFTFESGPEILQDLGSCKYCMQKSFVAFIISLAASALVLSSVGAYSFLATAVLVCAFGLTLLWISHVLAYIFRSVVRSNSGFDQLVDKQRRSLLANIGKSAIAAILVSVPVALIPSGAQAFCGQCTKNADCGVGWSCKNTAAYNAPVCNCCVKD